MGKFKKYIYRPNVIIGSIYNVICFAIAQHTYTLFFYK